MASVDCERMEVDEKGPESTFTTLDDFEASLSYANQWKRQREERNQTIVFDAAWHQEGDSLWLVACTSLGELVIWGVPPKFSDQQMQDWDSAALQGTLVLRKKVSQGVLYSCCIDQKNNDGHLLLISGDGGVLVWDWEKQIAPLLSLGRGSTNDLVSPLARLQPHVSINVTEINQVVVAPDRRHVLGASGDAFGVYKWDLETQQIVNTYRQKHQDGYLHTVSMAGDNTMIAGGEGGVLGVWDINQDKQVDGINVQGLGNKGSGGESRWIACCAGAEDFWNVGGGKKGGGGFMATFHASTRSLVASVETEARPHAVCRTSGAIVSVGNDGCTSYWDPWTLRRSKCIQSGRVTSYALAVSPDGRLATGGLDSSVDVLEDGGIRSLRLVF